MGKPGRPSPGLDDYLYWQERLASREASGLSIDEFCADEDISRSTFYRWAGRLKDGIPDAVKEEGEREPFTAHGRELFRVDAKWEPLSSRRRESRPDGAVRC